VPTYTVRIYGDPVLKQRATEVTDITGSLAKLADDMLTTMYAAPGVGLAAPQVGIQKRLFVYDLGDDEGPRTVINPEIIESSGEWIFDEGCLSVPGLYFPITRPKDVHLRGYDLNGQAVDIEASEFHARVLQHEVDHLDGRLLLEHLDPEQRKEALRALRMQTLDAAGPDALRL
jgi:peptide deformylase